MHGFKSFADPAIIEFDKGVTCVVGPNGSGKSNISDAIRWVLGEQSAKTLRGGKMEDVIFAGTTGRKSRGMAEVTLVIDNNKGILPIEYNEVAVTRRMYRSGESEYAINNNPCRMKDVRELFMDTGIGVDGYSLIGQGKISDIISNKSESIREIFEETAGVVMYRSRKAKAESKLKSTSINLDRVNDIIGEIEGRIDGLREDSQKAKEFVQLRDRYKELEINITLKNIESLQSKNGLIKDDVEQLEISVSEKTEQKRKFDAEKDTLAKETEQLEAKSEEAKEKMLKAIENINTLESESEINDERLQSKEKDRQRLLREIEEIEENLEKENIKENENEQLKEEVGKEAEKLKLELNEKNKNFDAKKTLQEKTQTKIEEEKERLFAIQKEIAESNNEKTGLISVTETLERRKIQILEELEAGVGNLKEKETTVQELETNTQSLRNTLKTYEEEEKKLTEEIEKTKTKEEETLRRLENIKIQESQFSSRKKTIEEMESNYEGYFGAVKFIMQRKKQGIEGVVAELIEVPQGFEVAFETALGGSLQNIICQRDEDAKRSIKELKEYKAGRLTFLPIESISPRAREKMDLSLEKGFKGYGTDIIDFNPKYTGVMEHLLGNVIIAEDMDAAIAMAKKAPRVRYVTLEGEVISVGGAITGGKFKNKTANILERRAEIAKLTEEIEGLEKESKIGQATLEKNKEHMLDAQIKYQGLKENMKMLERQLLEEESQINIYKSSLNDYESTKEKWNRELLEIEKEQQNAVDGINQLDSKIKGFDEKFKENESYIEELMTQNESERLVAETLKEEITKIRISFSEKDTEKNKLDAIMEIVKGAIKNLERSKAEKQDEIAEIEKEKEENYKGNEGSKEIIQKLKEEKEILEKEMQEISTMKAESYGNFSTIMEKRDQLDIELEKIQNQKHELSLRIAKQETQLENLTNKLWEEFEVSYIGALEFKREDFVMSTSTKENKEIKERMRFLGDVNVGAIEEYERVKEKYEFLTEQKEDIEKSSDELKSIIKEMDKIITVRFKESFDQIVVNFEEVFKEFFGGGAATITIDDEANPLDATIEINAQPPGKQLKHINLLSGGEKTMTAIALMFAVLKTKPTPCCILDEVEAALDDANIDIFAKYLRKFEEIQFTLITHQKATMEHADAMYGITMPERGISKIYSLKMEGEQKAN